MRNVYSLSHLSHRAYHVGRVQTLSVIPVEAGCSLELAIQGIARMAAPRKEIVSDCQFDVMAFYVSHRICYGQTWIDFINKGPTATPFTPPTPINVPAASRRAPYLTLNVTGAQINPALVIGYNKIMYNYFNVPSFPFNPDNAGVTTNSDFTWFPHLEAGAENCRKYGRLAGRLKHVLNGGNMVDATATTGWEAQSLTDADQEVPIDAVGGTFNLTDLADIQGRYKSKVAAAWFAHFYQDVMFERYGTKIGPDADPRNLRPHMLGRKTSMISGHDVDGTDDARLGTYQGKVLANFAFSMRRKIFPEHGNVYIMGLFRYPLVHTDECHPLLKKQQWTYNEVSGDPETIGNQTPITFDPSPWLHSGSLYTPDVKIKEPYGQHYRFQNNVVHPNFKTIPGYPFSTFNGATYLNWLYYQDNEYANTFLTPQIGQAQTQALMKVNKFSLVPGVSSSYFAGT